MSQPDLNNKPVTGDSKWTEIEHLTDWDEEFYHVYTAKKYGKWLMLKTLKPEYCDNPECREMIGREFDARYNLSHPNITMINDFEDVPGVGLSIITDDVYGESLRKLIDKKAVTAHHIEQLRDRLPLALQYIQENRVAHNPIRPETIIFTENIGNLKLIDVGFEQRPCLTPRDVREDVKAYGNILLEAIAAADKPYPALKRIAERCVNRTRHPITDAHVLMDALHGHGHNRIYLALIIFLMLMIGVLLWFNSSLRPATPVEAQASAPAIENVVAE